MKMQHIVNSLYGLKLGPNIKALYEGVSIHNKQIIRHFGKRRGVKIENGYHWLFLTKPFDLEGLV